MILCVHSHLLVLALGVAPAQADPSDAPPRVPRIQDIYLGSQSRVAQGERTLTEISIGLQSQDKRSLFLISAGLALPQDSKRLVIVPITAGWAFSPLATRVRPWLSGDIGAFVLQNPYRWGEEHPPEDGHWRIAMTLRAAVGLHWDVWGPIAIRIYGDKRWVQSSLGEFFEAAPKSGWGMGFGLFWRFAPNAKGPWGMVVHGRDAPKSF